MRNPNSWTYKDKLVAELSGHGFVDEDADYESDDSLLKAFQPKRKPTRVGINNRSFADQVDLISEIDQKIKEHFHNLLHAVESLSARATQLESRMLQVENFVDYLKESIAYSHGRTDGKLREAENILREVQGCIKDLRDKQEIAEAQVQLAKLQLPKSDTQSKKRGTTAQTVSNQEASSFVPQQSHQLLPNQVAYSQQHASLPSNISQNLHNQSPQQSPVATAPQLLNQIPQNVVPSISQPQSYNPSTVLTQETTHQNYHMPFMQQSQPPPSTLYQSSQSTPPASAHQQYLVTSSQQSQTPAPGLYQPNQSTPPTTTHQQYFVTSTQQSQLPSPALHQPYQPTPQLPTISQSTQPAQFSTISQSVKLPQLPTPSQSAQPPQLHSPVNPVYYQAHLPLSHQPEEVPYLSSQSIQKSSQPPGGFPPTEQFYVGSTQQIPDHSTSRHYLELPFGYSKPPEQSNTNNLFPYNEPYFGSSSSNMKPFQRASSPSFPGSGSSSSQLPTAKILPHALPTASILDSGSASSGNTNSVQVDDVVEKVVAMGFRRDLVRATVRNLTENRQSVDLNVVLDKLMNSR
ncbi:hypothetical protein Pint_15510 [Pistacia integerrima]|uniref:Uncharacterized protein n=1 Tax=Pistacia integerrima TaxID=434235 RepID=A0ACC0ZCF5_9ROSI|nr:hypothetical protein Pint_15510 [Pistacia integerrima]